MRPGIAYVRRDDELAKYKKPPACDQGLFDTGLLVGFFLAQHNPERATVRATDDPSLYGNGHPDLLGFFTPPGSGI